MHSRQGLTLEGLHEGPDEGLQAVALMLPSIRKGPSSCLGLLPYISRTWRPASATLVLPFLNIARQLATDDLPLLCLLT